MDNLMVSVIVPAFNTEKYIGKMIECVLAQTYTNLQLIFIDDGSTDKTSEIIKQYQGETAGSNTIIRTIRVCLLPETLV